MKPLRGARWLIAARASALLLAASALAALLAWKVWGFADPTNLQKLSVDAALVAIGAVGLTGVMLRGGVDLSVGAVLAVAAACSARAGGGGVVPAVAAAVAVGVGLGALNGAAAVVARLHSALVTFAALVAYTWLFLALLGGRDSVAAPECLRSLAQASMLGVQSVVWVAAAVVAGGALLLRRRGPGPASGGARLQTVGAFALCGAAAGLGGVLYAGEYARIVSASGRGFGLEALAAAALGGAALRAGTGSAIGAAAGAVLVGVLHNGMAMLDVGEVAQAAVFGAVLVASVLGNRELSRWAAR